MTASWPPPGTNPETQPPQGMPAQQAPPGYGYNWGLAYPVGYQPLALVPRPPRPGVVNVAVILTMVGVLVSAVQLAINMRYTYEQRDQIISQLNTGTAGGAGTDMFNTALTVGLAIGVLFWLLPAAGAVVTSLLARRGSNASRIVLASLMGVFALSDLCNGVFGLVSPSVNVSAVHPARISPVFNLVLAVLAVVIGVLVLVPSANRFFSPGPGRRFMAST